MMEIADVFAVNKADLPGASTVVRELRTVLNMGARGAWRPPIVATISNHGADPSHDELWEAVGAHRRHLAETQEGRAQTGQRLARAAAGLVAEEARAWALRQIEQDPELRGELVEGRLPYLVAERLKRAASKPYA
jgi:LAO/AO transport system kinase